VIYSGLPPRPGTGVWAEPDGPTVDQIIAAGLPGGQPTFNAGAQIDLSSGSPGRSRCFWRAAQQPISPQQDPVKSYADLFTTPSAAGAPPPGDAPSRRLLAERRSVLDYVGASLTKFGNRLGTDDRARVQAHADAIRTLERTLSAPGAECGGQSAGPIASGASYLQTVGAFFRLTVAALNCGATRVATVQLADALGANVTFPFLGIQAPPAHKSPSWSWSDIAQNPVQGGIDTKQTVDCFWMGQLAALIGQLEDASDPAGGTLLDNTVVLWGNDVHDGVDKDPQRLPWLLAGRAGGYLRTNQCLAGGSTTEVLAALCEAMGVTHHPYGAPRRELKA
jgi:hypothetical protein